MGPMRRLLSPLFAALLFAGCAGPRVEIIPGPDLDAREMKDFARSISTIRAINYTDPSREKPSYSPKALEQIRSLLESKGYLVRLERRFWTTAVQQPAVGGYRTVYLLRNDSQLQRHEGYLEVFTREELWDGDKVFMDYEEVGRVDPTSESGMVIERRPILKGHKNIRRSVEVEVNLYTRGRTRCVYKRKVRVKERGFNYKKAVKLALDGIPRRDSRPSKKARSHPFRTAQRAEGLSVFEPYSR